MGKKARHSNYREENDGRYLRLDIDRENDQIKLLREDVRVKKAMLKKLTDWFPDLAYLKRRGG